MITYYADDLIQLDYLQYLMDKYGIAYNTELKTGNTVLNVDGVPLDYDRALKWIESRRI